MLYILRTIQKKDKDLNEMKVDLHECYEKIQNQRNELRKYNHITKEMKLRNIAKFK